MTDASNLRFAVAGREDKIAILKLGIEITRDDALNLAAWLVALADPLGEDFAKLLEEVRSS